MTATKRVPRPLDATSRYLRQYLKKAGVEQFVAKIATGKDFTFLRLTRVDREDFEDETTANKVADALRPMWHDGDTRVKVLHGRTVAIVRKGWHRTMPNTAEGIAQLEKAEKERNEQLLAALKEGHDVRAECYNRVTYAPSETDPRKPWVKWTGARLTPWEVNIYRTH